MNYLEINRRKILDKESLKSKLAYWKFKDYQVVFTNGCFDIVHLGHIDYLSRARDLGDLLMIGLNTDSSVSRIKGPTRPINNEIARANILASLNFVDAIVLFDEETPYKLINEVKPDILVKGSDYKPEDIVGYDIVKKSGGRIETIDFLEGYSTSLIIEKFKQ
jgi:rfaE bifunctional protein nucleotidyltransferase chain/domain